MKIERIELFHLKIPLVRPFVTSVARYEDREVVRDGNLVTSRVPADLPAFCRTLIEAMAEAKVAAGR